MKGGAAQPASISVVAKPAWASMTGGDDGASTE